MCAWVLAAPGSPRLMTTRTTVNRVPPTSSESQELHSLYLKYGGDARHAHPSDAQDADTVSMEDTRLEKTMVMFPQERK